MAKRELRQKAIDMRLQQKSYSEIRRELGVSKSTVSKWLKDMPFEEDNISIIKKRKGRQIERFRNTMREKSQRRLDAAYASVSEKLGTLTEREIFIAGLFLYWGEGGKATKSELSLSNTNPQMVAFFIDWLKVLGIDKNELKVAVILYSDMNIDKEMLFWSQTLRIPLSQFYKPRIKKSKFSSITYKNGFGHGTCMIRYGNMPLWNLVQMGIKRLEDLQFEKASLPAFTQIVHAVGLEPTARNV